MVNRNIHNPHFPQTCPSRQSSAGMNISMPLLPLILQEREREREREQTISLIMKEKYNITTNFY